MMGKMTGVALLMVSSLFLAAWFPAMTPDQRIEMQTQWRWSRVETDLGNEGSLDEIGSSCYNDRGQLVWNRWDTLYDTHYQYFHYNAYGRLEYEEWDYSDDGTIDEVYSYDYNSSGMLFRLRMDFDADNTDEEAVYYSYHAGMLVQKEIDYDMDGTSDEITEYIYDQSGKVMQAHHHFSNPYRDNQTTYYMYNESGSIKSIEEDYDNDGLIDYASLYYYDTAGRPYREIDDDVEDDPGTGYLDATRTYFYDDWSDGCHDDCYGYYDDEGCFISTLASDHKSAPGKTALFTSGIVLMMMSLMTSKSVRNYL